MLMLTAGYAAFTSTDSFRPLRSTRVHIARRPPHIERGQQHPAFQHERTIVRGAYEPSEETLEGIELE